MSDDAADDADADKRKKIHAPEPDDGPLLRAVNLSLADAVTSPELILPHRVVLADEEYTTPITPEEEIEFRELAAEFIYDIPYCPWEPNPGPQTLFLLDFGRESLYGGACAGGKSIALLMSASQFLDVDGYSALILRKSFADLNRPLALMDIAEQWWRGQPGVRFIPQKHTYEFECPDGGHSRIEFGAMDTENDRLKYQGGGYHFCVEKTTPVLMADLAWKAIKDVGVGELVMTLEGPRKVTHAHDMGIKSVSAITTSSDTSVLFSSAHRFLVTIPEDDQTVPPPNLSREGDNTYVELVQQPATWRTPTELIQRSRERADELGLRIQYRTWRQESGASSIGGRSEVEGLNGSHPGRQQPQSLYVRAVLHELGAQLSKPGFSFESHPHVRVHDGDEIELQDSTNGCQLYVGSCDGRPRRGLGGGVDNTQRPIGAVAVLDRKDDQGSTPKRSPWTGSYVHPYTNEVKAVTQPASCDVVSIVPAGEAEVWDLTVDGANHYVTWGGIVASNCGYDELTQFKERDYRYLFSRMRRVSTGALSKIPIRMRSTTNPGGPGHEWVYRRFIADWESWFIKHTRVTRPRRNFHPALIADNPKLDEGDYNEMLAELDPVTRAQLQRGDWNIRPDGRMFRSSWFKPIQRADLPGNCRWVRFWDMASTDPTPGADPDFTCGVLVGRSPDGRYFIADVRRWRHETPENDLLCRATAMFDTRRVLEAMEQEPGSGGKTAIYHYRTYAFDGSNFRAVPASGKSLGRTTTITAGRKTPMAKILAAGPVASHAGGGNVYVVIDGSWDVDAFINEFDIFPDGEHDDQVDATAGAFALLAKMNAFGLKLGDSNEEFEVENQWRPDALPVLSLNMGEGWMGDRLREARVRSAAEIEAETRATWQM